MAGTRYLKMGYLNTWYLYMCYTKVVAGQLSRLGHCNSRHSAGCRAVLACMYALEPGLQCPWLLCDVDSGVTHAGHDEAEVWVDKASNLCSLGKHDRWVRHRLPGPQLHHLQSQTGDRRKESTPAGSDMG